MEQTEPWAWVVLTASFLALFLNSSLNYSMGVIHMALLEHYPEVNVTHIAWLGSLFSCMFAFTGVLASVIINVFNARVCVMMSGFVSLVGFTISSITSDFNVLFITFGIIAGCGQGLCHTGALVAVGYYFKHRSNMASGIALSGCGLCTFVFPPLTQYLLDTYGLHGAFLILGGIGFQGMVCGALMFPTKFEKNHKQFCRKNNNEKMDYLIGESKLEVLTSCVKHFELFKWLDFWGLLISSACFSMAMSTVYLFLPDFFVHHGSTRQEAAFIISVAGITGIMSRILLGFLASAVDTPIVYSGIFGIMGIITLFLNFMTSVSGKVIYTALYGFYIGGCWVIHYAFVLEVVGLENLSTGYGIVMMAAGTGYLIGPPIAEMIVLSFRDAFLAFVFAAICFFLASASGILTKLVMKQNTVTEVNHTNIGETQTIKTEKNADETEKLMI